VKIFFVRGVIKINTTDFVKHFEGSCTDNTPSYHTTNDHAGRGQAIGSSDCRSGLSKCVLKHIYFSHREHTLSNFKLIM
jgi:hypothetical protein